MTDIRNDRSERIRPTASQNPAPREESDFPGQGPRDWRGLARRRWPVVVAGLIALAGIVWAVTRADSSSEATDATVEEEAAGADTVVTLDSAAQRLAGIELVAVAASGPGELIANGTITYDANHVSVLSSRAEGRVVSVRADLGETVTAGTVLAILESPVIGQTRGALERAQASMEVARRNYERERRLFDQAISSQRELLEAEAALRSAEADRRSAAAELSALGASAGEGARFGLVSPITGTVVERNASPGQAVGPSTNLFTVANLRHVWITVDIYERDLRRVRENARAVVTPIALGGESFTGRVTYAGGVVDSVSHTFKVRVELENPGQRLRPGMFAQVRIETARGAGDTSLVIPAIAVQEVAGRQVVFVASETPGEFIVRPVTLGAAAGTGAVIVTDGIRVGERIVGEGAFQLKAELTKASFGEGGH